LGLWHWLPSRFVGNTAPKGSNGLPSFFLSLGLSTKAHPRSEKQGGPLLQSWLAGQAPLWAQELSSQWQVTLPPNPCCASCSCTCVILICSVHSCSHTCVILICTLHCCSCTYVVLVCASCVQLDMCNTVALSQFKDMVNVYLKVYDQSL
jgi:hypothetical protein